MSSPPEIYPNAPLKLVACELTFFDSLPIDLTSAQGDLYKLLRDDFPLPGPAPQQITVEVLGDGPPAATRRAGGFRFMDRRRSQSVLVTQRSIVIETSAYGSFAAFCPLVVKTAETVSSVVEIPGLSRIGLRYIDEIDEADLPVPNWSEYIAGGHLGLLEEFSSPAPEQFTTSALFQIAPDQQLTLRYGLLSQPVVDPAGPLRIAHSPAGRYFLIDIDSSWTALATEIPPFRADSVANTLEELHEPVRALFERMITDRLRDDVLRRERTS